MTTTALGVSESVQTPIKTIAASAPSDDFSDLRNIEFEAALTQAEVEESESKYNSIWGVKRRIALISLARSKECLVQAFGTDTGPELLFEMIDAIHDYQEHLKNLIEITEVASSRLLCIASIVIEGREDEECRYEPSSQSNANP